MLLAPQRPADDGCPMLVDGPLYQLEVVRRPIDTRLTPTGRAAFEQHVVALQQMVAGSGLSIVPR